MINNIFHISDIHIRLLKRHNEYKIVFNNLYKEIKDRWNENSLIVCTGDILHSKTDLSPEAIDMTKDFLKELTNIGPTIIIAGNHDSNLSNNHRLDSLTPIVDALDLDNLFYYRDTGDYIYENLHFGLASVFNKTIPDYKTLDDNKIKIAMYHGVINGSTTDLNHTLSSKSMRVHDFYGYDFTLLGDIHKQQYLNAEKTIGYVGSLIQQNHGETIDKHGMLWWDLEKKSSELIEITNDYGYVTLYLTDGKLQDISSKIPIKPRIRLLSEDTDITLIKSVLKEIKAQFDVEEVIINRVNNSNIVKHNNISGSTDSIGDIEYQNTLIKDFIKENYDKITKKDIEEIQSLNKKYNTIIKGSIKEQIPNWKIKNMKFSNLFSYGKNNYINFESIDGVTGLIGPNHVGKSALIDILLFTLFDKSSRAYRGQDIMNSKCNNFESILNFEINGVDYFIKKSGFRGKLQKTKEAVRVEIEFWKINDFGEKEILNSTHRRKTTAEILSYIGEYEDFILTAVSLQNNNTGFIDMKQTDRKVFLSQLLKMDLFDELYKTCLEDYKELSVLYRDFQNDDIEQQLLDAEDSITDNKSSLKKLKQDIKEKKSQLTILNKSLLTETSKLRNIDGDDGKLNEEELVNRQSLLSSRITDAENKDINVGKMITKTELLIQDQKKTLDILGDVKPQYDSYIQAELTYNNVYNKLEPMKQDLSHKLDKLRKLKDLKYDPNCTFCMDNVFVKDAIKTKKTIMDDKVEYKALLDDVKYKKELLDKLSSAKTNMDKWNNINNSYTQHNSELQSLQTQQLQFQNTILQLTNQLQEVNRSISNYNKNKENIDWNKIIKTNITSLTNEKQSLESELGLLNENTSDINGKLKVAEAIKVNVEKRSADMDIIERNMNLHSIYLKSISREGIPYAFISKVIPVLEQEINNILTMLVDFSVMFEMDGKNINMNILYDENISWPIELSSGFEKFVTSLAIRIALTKVSNLPKPNFIVIDEGFGNFDSDNLSNISIIFDYLRTQFDFVLVISHIETLKGAIDNTIEINRENDFSQINYS